MRPKVRRLTPGEAARLRLRAAKAQHKRLVDLKERLAEQLNIVIRQCNVAERILRIAQLEVEDAVAKPITQVMEELPAMARRQAE